MFPVITCLSDLAPFLVDRKEINLSVQENGYTVVCYAISTPTTFTDPDPIKQSFLRECRGITFYPDGKIASRPPEKFFNVDERESTMLYNLDMSSSNISRMMCKMDGSLILAVRMLDGTIAMKSKKSFTSDVAILANEFLYKPENAGFLKLCEIYTEGDITPIFEFTAPNNRIVLKYETTELTLLHARHNVSGEYLTRKELESHCRLYEVPLVEDYPVNDMQKLIDEIPTAEGIEGYVIQFQNGDMVKWKTPWYVAMHYSCVFKRRRDIAEMVLDEKIDDIKSAFKDDLDRLIIIEEIETTIVDDILKMTAIVECIVETVKDQSRKEIALHYHKSDYFSLLMDKFSGKEPKYVEFYKKNVLKEKFSLEQI